MGFTDLVKLLALAGGGYLGFAVDNRSMGYSTQGTLPVKLVRYIIGVAAILLIQASKPLLPPHLAFSALRYIATGLWATALYPAIGSRIRTGGSSTLFSVAS